MILLALLDHFSFWLMRQFQRVFDWVGIQFYITCRYCGGVLPISRNAVKRHMSWCETKQAEEAMRAQMKAAAR